MLQLVSYVSGNVSYTLHQAVILNHDIILGTPTDRNGDNSRVRNPSDCKISFFVSRDDVALRSSENCVFRRSIDIIWECLVTNLSLESFNSRANPTKAIKRPSGAAWIRLFRSRIDTLYNLCTWHLYFTI